MRRRFPITLATVAIGLLIALASPFGFDLLNPRHSDSNRPTSSSQRSLEADPTKSFRPLQPSKPTIEETEELLKTIELGDIDIPDLTLEDTITELNKKIEAIGIREDQLTIVFGHSIRHTLLVSEVRWHGIEHSQVSLQTVLTRHFDNLKIHHRIGRGIIELLPLNEETPLPGRELFEEKINDITLPVVSFDESNLTELTWFLSERSHQLDSSTPDAEFKGILFAIRPPSAGSIPFPKEGPWERRNLTIKQALDEVTQQTGTTWHVEDHAVIITAPH